MKSIRTTPVIDESAPADRTLSRVTLLRVCSDEQRLNRLKEAVHAAGFHLIVANSLARAWNKKDSFGISAVVIDRELTNDIAASAFRQRFIMLDLRGEVGPERVVMELTNLFNNGSEMVQ